MDALDVDSPSVSLFIIQDTFLLFVKHKAKGKG